MIILYHGSNQSVENPKILESKRALDFGSGFYLTSSHKSSSSTESKRPICFFD